MLKGLLLETALKILKHMCLFYEGYLGFAISGFPIVSSTNSLDMCKMASTQGKLGDLGPPLVKSDGTKREKEVVGQGCYGEARTEASIACEEGVQRSRLVWERRDSSVRFLDFLARST